MASALTAAGAGPALAAPPSNDNFADAQVISGLEGPVTGSNVDATEEEGEPDHAGTPGGASVWYRWTAPSDGLFFFDTCDSDFNNVIAVYTGDSVDALTEVTSNDGATCFPQSEVMFFATGGTVYHVAVDGPFVGNVVLDWEPYDLTPPPNDKFADAEVISGPSGSVEGSNDAAYGEPGEPEHLAGVPPAASIWYRWTAPADGEVSFDTCGSKFDSILAGYAGSSLDNLTQIGSDYGGFVCEEYPELSTANHQSAVTFTAVEGTVYYLAVSSTQNEDPNVAGDVDLSWTLSPTPTTTSTSTTSTSTTMAPTTTTTAPLGHVPTNKDQCKNGGWQSLGFQEPRPVRELRGQQREERRTDVTVSPIEVVPTSPPSVTRSQGRRRRSNPTGRRHHRDLRRRGRRGAAGRRHPGAGMRHEDLPPR